MSLAALNLYSRLPGRLPFDFWPFAPTQPLANFFFVDGVGSPVVPGGVIEMGGGAPGIVGVVGTEGAVPIVIARADASVVRRLGPKLGLRSVILENLPVLGVGVGLA